MMIVLTAPMDLQQTAVYEAALDLLRDRYGEDAVTADRDLFEDFEQYKKSWKQVYDPSRVTSLYVLSREDGSVGSGVFQQWRRLSDKHGVPAHLIMAAGQDAAELGPFTLSELDPAEQTNQVFAVVSLRQDNEGLEASTGADAETNAGGSGG